MFGRATPWVQEGCAEYLKRMPEVSMERIPDKPSKNHIERMIRHAGQNSVLVLLDERGMQLSSVELASRYRNWCLGRRDVCFLIGDVDGFSSEHRTRVDFVWSLSRLTLPYALTRLVLLEQLYRARSIVNGHPYHNG